VEIVAALAGIASVLLAWIVGGRLIWLSRRTRQAPELLIGSGLVLAGGAWSPLVAIGRQATALPDATRAGLVVAGALCGIAGMSCIAVFNWRVFRPASAWGPVLAGAVAAGLVALFAAQTLDPGWLRLARQEQGPWTGASWAGAVNYLWSFLEAWHHHAMLARRQRLGLADPIVADRMRLWTLLMLTSLIASIVFGTFQTLGIPVGGTLLGLSLAAIVAGVTSVLLWLAFLPPPAYLEAVRRRALARA
jgi:hypothetical protein